MTRGQPMRLLGSAIGFVRRAPPPGARPGQLAVPEHAPPPQLRVLRYTPDRCEEGEIRDVNEVAAWIAGGGVTWIDVTGFGDEALLERLREILDLHPLALADVVHTPQRPKLEAYGDRHLIVMQMARVDVNGEIEIEQLSLVLGPGWVVSFQERPGDVFDPLRERLRTDNGVARSMGADFLVYALVDAVVDAYFTVVEHVGEVLEGLEEAVVGRPGRSVLNAIHATRRTLLNLHRTQWRQRDTLNEMLRSDRGPFGPSLQPYLRDVHDHAMQILDVIETYREMTVGLMDIYLSSVSNRMNEVMKTLTVMASIFIPLTFLAGVYGMNFENMPELRWRWGYPGAWAAFALLALGMVGWFWRRGWLSRGDADASDRDD